MSSIDETCDRKNESTEGEVVLRDLQSLLRQTMGDEVIVVDYKTARLLQKGENYASTILKVDSIVKRTKDSEEVEELPLIAKMILNSSFHREHLDISNLFAKEIFVFEKLIPAYRELEREAGIPDEDLIDVLPKYYGGRLSLIENKKEVDDDVVLLMENLLESGYRTMNRKTGLDFSHATLAIGELARYHALGIKFMKQRPELFEECKKLMGKFPFKGSPSEFEIVFKTVIDSACKDPRVDQYRDRIVKTLPDLGIDFAKTMEEELIAPYISLTHGDFWVNNILFSHENAAHQGRVKGVKFVDWQIAMIGNNLKDLPYFLCANCDLETMENHLDDLIDTYYDKFINTLNKINYDSSAFTRSSFDEVLCKMSNRDLLRCLMTIRMFTLEKTDEIDLDDFTATLMINNDSTLCVERTWTAVSKFVEKGWI